MQTTTLLLSLAASVSAILPVTGPTGNTAGINTTTAGSSYPTRQEITAWSTQAGPGWDLYVQCMATLQSRPQDQINSWFQLAGIHGKPYAPWDGVQAAPGRHGGGFCPHSSILFPTWHRPYLAMMEQAVWNCSKALADTYPTDQKAKYKAAADSLRLPYWDWVSNAQLPNIVTQENVTVNTPKGKQSVANPLYQYKFHPMPPANVFSKSDAPTHYQMTVRQPDASGRTNHSAVNQALLSNAGYLHDTTYLLLTRDTKYDYFSNNAYSGPNTGYDSIENPHGTVHNCVGGTNGHMTWLDYSAFDPTFWLHHANVDRLIAIWQALNPDSFGGSQQDGYGTYSIAAGTVETMDTPLGPFHKDAKGNMWTSNQARNISTFGYTYPEIDNTVGLSKQQISANVRAKIKALYDPQGKLSGRAYGSSKPGSTIVNPASKHNETSFSHTPALDPSVIAHPNGTYQSYALRLIAPKFALDDGSSYTLFFFLAAEPESADPSDWTADPNLVASFPVLRGSSSSPPTEAAQKVTVKAEIPLTRALTAAARAGRLPDTGNSTRGSADAMDAFLRKNLCVHAVKSGKRGSSSGGLESVSVEKTLRERGLRVKVVAQEVHPNGFAEDEDDWPVFGTVRALSGVVKGKLDQGGKWT